MNHVIHIEFVAKVSDSVEVQGLIIRCANQVLESEGLQFDAQVNVTVVDSETIRALNRDYRDKDMVTDVLSFPMYTFLNGKAQEKLEEERDTGRVLLGDMVLCYDRAVAQAAEYGHSPARECGFLTTHSVLHLLGYDHERDEADTALMRSKEEDNLSALGLTRDAT